MRRAALLTTSLVVAAACTDTIPEFGLDVIRPSVASTVPAAGSTGADRDSPILVQFSEVMQTATMTTATLQIRRAGVPVPGTLAPVTTTSATFTPTARLDDLTEYEIYVAPTVRDRVGYEMSTPFTATFTTEDLEWEPPFAISTTAGGFAGSAGIDASGNVMVVWAEPSAIYAQRIVGGEFESAELVDVALNSADVLLGVAADGAALAAWTEADPVNGRLDFYWSTRSAATGLWTSPGLVETLDTGRMGNARMAVNRAGYAIAAWNQTDSLSPPFRFNAFARFYAPESGWGFLTSLESLATTAEPPEVGIGANGNGAVNWVQSDGSAPRTWGAYVSAGGWTQTTNLVPSGGGGVGDVLVDSIGTAVVNLGAFVRYVPDQGWDGPHALPNTTYARVAIGGDGKGFLAWVGNNGANDEIWAQALDVRAVTFGPAILVASFPTANTIIGRTTLDDSGRALILWLQTVNGRPSLVAARSTSPDVSWSPPALLEDDDIGSVQYIRQAQVGPGGEGVVLYWRDDGVTSRLWGVLLR